MNAVARIEALAPLHALGTLSLAELNAEAALQTRVDRKYILDASALPAVLDALPRATQVLTVEGAGALRYESHYFDTPALDSYLGAARGRRRRFKVRSRSYVDSDVSFLEVKTRGGRATTVKERVPFTAHGDVLAVSTLDAAGAAYAEEMLQDAGIPAASAVVSQLRPQLTTRYRRVTLLLPASVGREASRATIDIDLRWLEPGGSSLALPDAVIVETKSERHAGDFDRALWQHGHRPSTISKYGTGLAALHPELPSTKWRRVLVRHFREPASHHPTPQTFRRPRAA